MVMAIVSKHTPVYPVPRVNALGAARLLHSLDLRIIN